MPHGQLNDCPRSFSVFCVGKGLAIGRSFYQQSYQVYKKESYLYKLTKNYNLPVNRILKAEEEEEEIRRRHELATSCGFCRLFAAPQVVT
jgi:hypothetical protein